MYSLGCISPFAPLIWVLRVLRPYKVIVIVSYSRLSDRGLLVFYIELNIFFACSRAQMLYGIYQVIINYVLIDPVFVRVVFEGVY